jgi:hypothetical protein
MLRFCFEELNTHDPLVREEYERAFHDAFIQVTTNRLIHKLWLWDYSARRVETRIPYDEQVIFALRDEAGRIETAMAFNVGASGWQSSAFGFAGPATRHGSCEILTFFSVADHTLSVKLAFWRRCVTELRARGFENSYATTALRPLASYMRLGWRVIASKQIEGEPRYFLRHDLKFALKSAAG